MDKLSIQRRKESLDLMLQGLETDPFDDRLGRYIAFRLAEFGRLREAMDILDRFTILPQGKGRLWWAQFEILQNYGRFDEKFAYHIEALKSDPVAHEKNQGHLWWTVSDIAELGLTQEAEELYELIARIPVPDDDGAQWWRQHFLEDFYLQATGRRKEWAQKKVDDVDDLSNDEILKAWYVEAGSIAFAFWFAGDKERAIKLFEALQHYQHNPSMWAEREAKAPMDLAWMYLQVGRDDDAAPLLQNVIASLQSEVDTGARHPETLLRLAEAYAWQNDHEAALEMLDLAIDYGAYYLAICGSDLVPLLAEDWAAERHWWDGLEGDPRFILARSRMRSIVEQQRSNIRALLAQNDMDELLAPLINSQGAPATL